MADSSKRFGFEWPAIALVAVSLGAYFFSVPEQITSRPAAPPLPRHATEDAEQDIDARLWQDPLEAVANGLLESRTARGDRNVWDDNPVFSKLFKIWDMGEKGEVRDVVLYAVMINSGPHSHEAERRRRTRRAVVEALGRGGFVPEDHAHLGCVSVTKNSAGELTNYIPPPKAANDHKRFIGSIPFEWFVPNPLDPAYESKKAKRLLIIWVGSDLVAKTPLARLNEIWVILGGKLNSQEAERGITEIKIIGPESSTGLRAMISEVGRDVKLPEFITSVKTDIFAGMPTASDDMLLDRVPNSQRNETVKQFMERMLMKGKDFRFHRCIGTDDQTIAAIVEELQRRCVSPGHDHVAILSEWDTFYGRALHRTFVHVVERQMGSHERSAGSASQTIHYFSYLAGVDGFIPAPKKEMGKGSSKDDPLGITRHYDSPEGVSQADYIARVADQLQETDRRLMRENGPGGGLKAVGVLGSDIYDKLMILRALRPRFPKAVFFTNTLDIRLAHPDEWDATHNLVVGSSYGLALRGELQASIPPFRDSYQTATYGATLMALGVINPELLYGQAEAPGLRLQPPRLYEVGRHGPYELTVDAAVTGDVAGSSTGSLSIHPPRGNTTGWWLSWWRVGLFALLLVAVWALYNWISANAQRRVPGWVGGRQESNAAPSEPMKPGGEAWFVDIYVRLPSFLIISLVASYFTMLLFSGLAGPEGEPFAWWSGISIWPSMGLRLFGILLTLHFLLRALFDLNEARHAIERDTGLPARSDRPPFEPVKMLRDGFGKVFSVSFLYALYPFRTGWLKGEHADGDKWETVFRPALETKEPAAESRRRVDGQALYTLYENQVMSPHRVLAYLPPAIYFTMAGFVLLVLTGFPSTPARGMYATIISIAVFFLFVLGSVTLNFFVVDQVRLVQRFVETLNRGETEWPESVLKHHGADTSDKHFVEWIDMRVIAQWTAVVDRLIYYPFAGILVMIVSRLNRFDDWDWPVGLIIATVLHSGYAAYSLMLMRRTAARARDQCLARLTLARTKLNINDDAKASSRKSALEEITRLISEIRTGAFAPITEHPILGAILLPSSGVGLMALLQILR